MVRAFVDSGRKLLTYPQGNLQLVLSPTQVKYCAVDGLSMVMEIINFADVPDDEGRQQFAIKAFRQWRSRLVSLGVDEIIVTWDNGAPSFRSALIEAGRTADHARFKATVREWVRCSFVALRSLAVS